MPCGYAKVAGIFDRAPGSALPEAVTRTGEVASRDLPWDPDRPGRGTPIALADLATFNRVALDARQVLWTADADLADDPSPEQARRRRAVQRLGNKAPSRTAASRPCHAVGQARADPPGLASGLPDIVSRAETTTAVARNQSSAFVGAGIALGVIVVCAAAVLLGRSRRREQELMAGLGMRAGEVAGLAALEALLPVVVGVVGGAALAWVTVSAVGPPGAFREGALEQVVAARGRWPGRRARAHGGLRRCRGVGQRPAYRRACRPPAGGSPGRPRCWSRRSPPGSP